MGNLGDAASGQYDVSAVVWDVSRDLTYPAGSATKGSMQPGEEWPVISSDMTVLDPGSYQLKVEVSPWDGDANDQNNTYIWAFTVQ